MLLRSLSLRQAHPRPRFLRILSMSIVLALGLVGGVRVIEAQGEGVILQNAISGDSNDNGSNTPSRGASRTPSTDFTPYVSSLTINDPTIEPQYRQGNCCVPWQNDETPSSYIEGYVDEDSGEYVAPRVQCFYNIGNDLTNDPKAQIAACKNFQYTENDSSSPLSGWSGVLKGIHYDLTNSVLCGVRCLDLMPALVYCDPDRYQCLTKQEIPVDAQGNFEYDNLIPYLDRQSCSAACRRPVGVAVSIGCACNASERKNTCTVYAWQDTYTDDVDLSSLTLSLSLSDSITPVPLTGANGSSVVIGSVEDPQSYVVDDAAAPVEYVSRFLQNDPYDQVIEFVPENGAMRIPSGFWFTATVAVDAVDGDPAELTIGKMRIDATVRGGDPNPSNNSSTEEVQSLSGCRKFNLNAACTEASPQSEYAGETYPWHDYTLDLRDYQDAPGIMIDFGDPGRRVFSLDTCLDSDPGSMILPAGCQRLEEENRPFIRCQFPLPPTSITADQGIPPAISFGIFAQGDGYVDPASNRVCRTGEPISMQARVTRFELLRGQLSIPDNAVPDQFSITENMIACGACDVCNVATSQAACQARSPNCSWEQAYNKSTERFESACVRNEDVCDVYYGCCKWLPPDASGDQYAAYRYAGRADGAIVAYGSDGGALEGTPAIAAFEEARMCVEPEFRQCGPGLSCPTGFACNAKGECYDPNIISVQKRYDPLPADDYEYWKIVCEIESTSSSSSSSKAQETNAADKDYFCSNFFDENFYNITKYVLNDDYLEPANLENLEPYTNQKLKDGSVFFTSAYSPVPHFADFETFALAINGETGYNAQYGVSLTPELEYGKSDGPDVCERAMTYVTCGVAGDPAVAPEKKCLVLTRAECANGTQMPVGPETMAECVRQQTPVAGGVNPFGPVPPEWINPFEIAGQGNNPPLMPGLEGGPNVPVNL